MWFVAILKTGTDTINAVSNCSCKCLKVTLMQKHELFLSRQSVCVCVIESERERNGRGVTHVYRALSHHRCATVWTQCEVRSLN